MTDPNLHDQIVVFMQEEHRGGFLLADPLTVCTIGFWEHLAEFIASQECERCHQLEAHIAHLNREIANCQPTLSNPNQAKFDKADRPLPQTSEGC